MPSLWKLLQIPSLILLDKNNEDDPDNNCTTSTDRSSPSATTVTVTTSNSFHPESRAATETLDRMFRLLERLDGRRSRNSSVGISRSKCNSNSRNNTRNSHSRNNNDDNDDGRHSLLPKVSLSQSYDTADTDIEEEEYSTETTLTTTTAEGGSRTTLLWFTPENTQSFSGAASAILQRKGVTWADEQPVSTGGNGKNDSNSDKRLVTRYTYTPLPEQYFRVVILLLHPVELQFEFVHAEYDTDVRLTVAQVLKQLGRMAVSPALKELEWGALCLRDTQREMINCMTLQEYNLYDGSMLIAVPKDYAPKIVLEQAGFFLKDKVLRRVVRRAKMTGQSPQRLLANPDNSNTSDKCNSSDTSDTEEGDDNSVAELPSADPAPVPSSLSFDASVVVSVPSIQDDDFDDFWGRVDKDDVHATVTKATTSTANTSKSWQWADKRFFDVADEDDNDRYPFDFTGDLVRLPPLPANPVVEVQVQQPETATTPSISISISSSEPAAEIAHPNSTATNATASTAKNQESSSNLAETISILHTGSFTETKATNETTATNEDLYVSTFADVLDVPSDKLRLIHSF